MKAIIGNGIASAIQNDTELTKYYQRKLEEGKHKMEVLNAVKNKLISRVFAVIKKWNSIYLSSSTRSVIF
jgi:hypothetical protein